jgi:uncharacterized protein YciI
LQKTVKSRRPSFKQAIKLCRVSAVEDVKTNQSLSDFTLGGIAMLYIRLCVDKPGTEQLRNQYRGVHREYLASGVAKLIQAGPLMSSDETRNVGSFMVVEADSLEAVRRFHDNDPFTKAGLFEEVRIHRWDKHVG